MASKLPTPRMQLRWEVATEPGHQWQCHYELVILLDKWDVRREVYKRGRELKRKLPRELVIPMKTPSFRNSSSHYPPCTSGDGKQRYADTPFRDGAHAKCPVASRAREHDANGALLLVLSQRAE